MLRARRLALVYMKAIRVLYKQKRRSITTDVRANVTFEVILEQCVT